MKTPNTSAPDAVHTQALMPAMVRAAMLNPATFDDTANTVEVVWTTGAIVPRFDWGRERQYDEELVVSAEAIDLARMNAGASVLNTHAQYTLDSVIGVVERAWLDGAEGRATVRLSERPELAGLVADIKSGVIRHISAGYSVQRMEMVPPEQRTDGGTRWLYRATRWTPAEISFVPVPADAGSGTRSAPEQGASPCEFTVRAAAQQTTEELRMDPKDQNGGAPATPATPAVDAAALAAMAATRAADISELCTRHAVPELAPELIRSGADLAAAQAKVLDKLAHRDAAAGGHTNVASVRTVSDEHETRMAGIAQALQHRLDPKTQLDDNGRRFRSATLLELGRTYLQSRGVNTDGMDKMNLAHTMMATRATPTPVTAWNATGDFPGVLANVANKRLRDAYMEDAGTYTIWARRAPNAPDFKQMTVAQLSGAPNLEQINEEGEYTYGTMTDAATNYSVMTYGKIVALTRQAIINDDLRAFDRLVTAFGYAARRKENQLVYAQLQAAGNYSSGNGNLGAAALSFDALTAMRTAMRKQTGLAGEKLNLGAAFLIVPPSLEGLAYQLTSPNYVPATQLTTSEFRTGGRTALEPVVEAVLEDTSTTAWYAAANTGMVDTVEYCYLDGAEGPVTESKTGWEIDGMEMKVRLDFAAKAIDYRGIYKSVPA
jgi:hypothetical protein